jgi:preprotein translocase subunit YajC
MAHLRFDDLKAFATQEIMLVLVIALMVIVAISYRVSRENLLHNQSTIALGSALRAQGTRVVTTVGVYL